MHAKNHRFLLGAFVLFVAGRAWGGPSPGPELAFRPIPGVSPEPVVEGAGLKGREDLEAFFDGVMAAHLRQNALAGALVAVVKDHDVVFTKGYGFANAEKRTPVDGETTLFRPGSIGKLLTWTAVMQQVEQGKLDLDTDVNVYLKQFGLPSTYPQPVTLRNLLTHTGGFEERGIGIAARGPEGLLPLAAFLPAFMPARVRPPTTDFTDGTNASYSNWSASAAGLIVSNVSGLTYDDYVDKYIFEPLGMRSSTTREPLPSPLAPRMAAGHMFSNGKLEPRDFEYLHNVAPAGSMTSSAPDMAQFMIAHLNGGSNGQGQILRPETVASMQRRALSPNPHVSGACLGLYETWINGRRTIGHAGDTLYFHSDLMLIPEEKVGVFVSYNTSNQLGPLIARRDLMQAFMDRYYPARLPAVTPPKDFMERAARYAGTYRSIRHSHTKFEKVFALFGGVQVIPMPDDTLLITDPSSVERWVEVAPDVFRQVNGGRTIAFAKDAGGVTHLVGGLPGEPLPFLPESRLATYETPRFHYFILLFASLCSVAAVASALRNWRADRSAPAKSRWARRLAGLVGLLQIGFVVVFVASFAALEQINDIVYGAPSGIRVAVTLPLIAIVPTLGTVWLLVVAWRERYWTLLGRIRYGVIVAMSLAFLWSLSYWNLLGYRFS